MRAEAVQRFLAAVAPERGPAVTGCRHVSGGYSRETAIAEVRWADGSMERLVLRSDPPPGQGVFDSDRDAEWRLLSALAACPQAPTVALPRWYDAGAEHLGSKCIVSAHYDGRPLSDLALETSDAGADLGPLRDLFVDVTAAVHATPLEGLGLPQPAGWESYLDGLLDLLAGLGAGDPTVRYAARVLRDHRPPPVPLTLVHGDWQPSNVLVGDAGPLVIDWEFTRVGDPREELAYYLQSPMHPNLYLLDPEAFLARYRDRTGLSEEQVSPRIVEWFLPLGIARLLAQVLAATDAVARGGSPGIMASYLVNAASLLSVKFFDIARGLG